MRRRGRIPGNGFGTGLVFSALIVVLAVAAGYAGTKYILYPYVLGGGGSDGTQAMKDGSQMETSGSGVVIGEQQVTDLTPGAVSQTAVQSENGMMSGGTDTSQPSAEGAAQPTAQPVQTQPPAAQVSLSVYSLQFGSFSTQEAAQKEQQNLLGRGLSTYVWQTDGAFKVMGMPYLNKDQAKAAAGVLKASVSDVYVSTVSVGLPDETQKSTLTGLLNSYAAVEQSQDPNKTAVLSGLQGPIITMMEGLMK